MPTYEAVLQQALQLPWTDRERLAHELLRSMGPPGEDIPEEEWTAAWAAEIERRLQALKRGEAKTVPWSEAIRQLQEAVHARRKLGS